MLSQGRHYKQRRQDRCEVGIICSSKHLAIARVVNLARTLRSLKKAGAWLVVSVAADPSAVPAKDLDLPGPKVLIIGSEGSGVRPLIDSLADARVTVPMAGRVGSLNASVAAGILFYELSPPRR